MDTVTTSSLQPLLNTDNLLVANSSYGLISTHLAITGLGGPFADVDLTRQDDGGVRPGLEDFQTDRRKSVIADQ